jgi:hypothetical protein
MLKGIGAFPVLACLLVSLMCGQKKVVKDWCHFYSTKRKLEDSHFFLLFIWETNLA